MLGGCDVETEEEARAFSKMPHVMREVQVGEHLETEPCVSRDYIEQKCERELGQRCPRVVIEPDNVLAMEVLAFAMAPRKRELAPRFLAALRLRPQEELELIRRVAAVLDDPFMNPSEAAAGEELEKELLGEA